MGHRNDTRSEKRPSMNEELHCISRFICTKKNDYVLGHMAGWTGSLILQCILAITAAS